MKRSCVLCVASLAAAALLGACDPGNVAPEDKGALALLIQADASVAAAVDAGTVHIEGPSPRTVSISPGEERTITGLLPGSYTVALEGFQSGRLAVFGQTNVTVVAGENRNASINLESFVPAFVEVPAEVVVDQPLEVRYGAVPGAISYLVEWADNPGFSNVQSVAVSDTTTTIHLDAEGTHHVRVYARNRFGSAGVPMTADPVQAIPEVLTIDAARSRSDGDSVRVEGIVLADQGTYDFLERDTYIQDSTAGVHLWALSAELGLQEGDSVTVAGVMATFRSKRQIEVGAITVVGTGTVPAPRPVTGAEISSFAYQGELGVTGPVTVVQVTVFSFDAHNVTVRDSAGATFAVRMESPNEIPSDFWEEGETYRVTGVLARHLDEAQIKPRGFRDVERL